MRWVIIIAFNILFGLFSGLASTMVFGSKDGWASNGNAFERKENKKMILLIAFSAAATGMLGTLFFSKDSSWQLIGLGFGMTTTIVASWLIYLYDTSRGLVLRPRSEMNPEDSWNFLSELYKSVSLVGTFWMSFLALLYGTIFLLTPLLGLLWGYLMHYYVLKMK